MQKCFVCKKKLVGRQKKFCSQNCKNRSTNNVHQNYITQQKRGKHRRNQLIQLLGGKCQQCGYNRSAAALAFHHRDPKTKKFQVDIRKCSNSSWDALIQEASKCVLLCLNCHAELHFRLGPPFKSAALTN